MATSTANDGPLYNIAEVLETDMTIPIPEPALAHLLSQPPFLPIPGILNLRDLGLSAPSYIRPNLLFRSGALASPLPPSSIASLKDTLSIKIILDLRSEREIARAPDPILDGVENLWVKSERAPTPISFQGFEGKGAKEGYKRMYEEVLEIHKGSFGRALEWVRDGRGAVLFHCSAGKDRTGVLATIFLALAGAPKDVIAYDYALSRIGIEPGREVLIQMMKSLNQEWSEETPGMREFSQVRAEFMEGMLEMMDVKYGGVEGYVRGLGFGDEDLVKIRGVLKGEEET